MERVGTDPLQVCFYREKELPTLWHRVREYRVKIEGTIARTPHFVAYCGEISPFSDHDYFYAGEYNKGEFGVQDAPMHPECEYNYERR